MSSLKENSLHKRSHEADLTLDHPKGRPRESGIRAVESL